MSAEWQTGGFTPRVDEVKEVRANFNLFLESIRNRKEGSSAEVTVCDVPILAPAYYNAEGEVIDPSPGYDSAFEYSGLGQVELTKNGRWTVHARVFVGGDEASAGYDTGRLVIQYFEPEDINLETPIEIGSYGRATMVAAGGVWIYADAHFNFTEFDPEQEFFLYAGMVDPPSEAEVWLADVYIWAEWLGDGT